MTSITTFGADVKSIKEFVSQDLATRLGLVLIETGALSKEPGTYSFTNIATELAETSIAASMRMNSVTAFGREWMAFASSDGLVPATLPFTYDGTSLYRAAFPGPGGPPTAAASGAAGTVAQGVRKFRVFYTDKYGHISPPSPSGQYTASDSTKSAAISAIPTGPAWVTGRIIGATVADDEDYYYVPASSMVILDNTTTSATLNFTDSELLAGVALMTSSDQPANLNRQIALPAQSWVGSYSGRLVWLGERSHYVLNGDVGPRNLEFNGGFATNVPLGWTELVAGEAKGTTVTGSVGDFLMITGNGSQRGTLQNNSVLSDFIDAGKALKVRVRLRKSAALAAGTFHIYLTNSGDPSGGALGGTGVQINMTSVSTSEWRWFEGTIATFSGYSNDSRIRISGGDAGTIGGTALTSTGILYIDQIELFAAEATHQPSLARWSKANKPASYHGQTGFQYVAQDNGQRLTSGFTLGDSFYYVKERSMWVTRDDAAREPADWPVDEVSSTVGSPSAKGIGYGDQWVIVAGRAGLYYFDGGGVPLELSKWQRPTWNRINWLYGRLIQTFVDMDRNLIFVAVPLDAATVASTILCFQWFGDRPTTEDLEFNRWTLPSGAAVTCFAYSERSDGTRHLLVGTDGASFRMARLDDTVHSDWAAAIDSYYRTAFLGRVGKQLLFKRLTMGVRGNGTLAVDFYHPDGTTASQPGAPDKNLSASPRQDTEYPVIRHRGERMAVHVGTNAADEWFSLEKLGLFADEPVVLGERGER